MLINCVYDGGVIFEWYTIACNKYLESLEKEKMKGYWL